jgi:spore maturation protein CgeB
MRILYVASRYDYGDPQRGLSFEETNFRGTFEGMGHEIIAFDFLSRARRDGAARMRKDLIASATETKPDLAFFFLFTNELDVETIAAVARVGECPTVNWFADDHWRFERFTRHFAPAFDLAVTTDADSLPKYRELDNVRVHLSQWACNRYAYDRVSTGQHHGVTFVGQAHGNRGDVIGRVRNAGYQVECWGHGWPAGRLDHAGMVEVFSTSAINLNLSMASVPSGLRAHLRRVLSRESSAPSPPQIKGRNFEVPGCGGFMLTERVPHLETYFDLETEIATYDDLEDLVAKVAYWSERDEERAHIADAGYQRVRSAHTYDHRFNAIFAALGLGIGAVSAVRSFGAGGNS